MQLQIALRAPGSKLLRCTSVQSLVQALCIQRIAMGCQALAQAWRERRRVERAYRCDLHTLAGMSERDLADIGAPCWLRADIGRYR